jgi:arylsulfatase A-like enzyme
MKIRATILCTLLAACGDNGTGANPDLSNNGGGNPDLSQPNQPPADMTLTGDMEPHPTNKRTIIFVWDGLRPDSITQADTPNLFALKTAGVEFQDNHSTYPTFTMMNAASLATGGFPATTGFYGNTLWQQGPTGKDSGGNNVDFNQPVFTEDWSILSDLDAYYSNQLLLVGTLFQAAQTAGLKTATVGKSGPAFLQDYKKGGWIVEEKMIWPLSLVQEIQPQNSLPATTPFAYPAGTVTLGTANGTPTSQAAKVLLADKITTDPTDKTGAPTNGLNYYMLNLYLTYVLPKNPDLSLIWFRSPDSTEHPYGPGSNNYRDALHAQDYLLGQLQSKLKELNLDTLTNIIVVSDHGHSTVSGPVSLFPLRAITAGAPGATDATNGYSVSGDVRTADLLTLAGIPNVFDGVACMYQPVMSGIKSDATTVYPTQTDTAGTTCGKAGTKYTSTSATAVASFKVPTGTLPAKAVVIATNGGSDYIYVPDHDATTVQNVVTALQKREEIGAIFVHSRYGALAGTLPLGQVKLENASRSPDIIYSFVFDDNAMVQGLPGIEYESMVGPAGFASNRGMHGSFSPRDVHNTLLASGPDFKTGFMDTLPTGNVDVAPTVAHLFGLTLSGADGRPLLEALSAGGGQISDYTSTPSTVNPPAVANIGAGQFQLPTDPTGATLDTALTVGSYSIDLQIKTLTKGSSTWTYFDSAKAVRQ